MSTACKETNGRSIVLDPRDVTGQWVPSTCRRQEALAVAVTARNADGDDDAWSAIGDMRSELLYYSLSV